MEYIKINSLWKRQGWYFDQDKKKSPDYQARGQSFIIGDYAAPEFGNVKKWHVEEKVDGTNIRIIIKPSLEVGRDLRFGGRTSNAHLPCQLLEALEDMFKPEKVFEIFKEQAESIVILYGEGYGPKIQACGGNYRKDPGFILFDVRVGDWWLKREDVKIISERLQVPMVPEIGIMTKEEIVEFVKSKPMSKCSHVPQMMEGIIARSDPLMLFRNGKPLMWKLKCKEFV